MCFCVCDCLLLFFHDFCVIFVVHVIGIAILIHNIIEAGQDPRGRSQHILSMFLVAPFIATSAGLLVHNWYPSAVFVGDTYTMFAGMCLAVCGVMGHFSKTLLI